MVKRRYYFPYVEKGTPFYHYALTSKTLMERLDEVNEAFKRFAANSNSQSPKHVLYLMLQHNESLLELSEYASAPTPHSPSVEPISERSPLSLSDSTQSGCVGTGSSSSHKAVFYSPPKKISTLSKAPALVPIPEESNPDVSDLKQEASSLEESAVSGSLDIESSSSHQMVLDSPPKKYGTTSKPTDVDPISLGQPPEYMSTEIFSHYMTVRQLSSPLKKPKRDISPTTCGVQEVDPRGKAEMDTKTDSKCPPMELKVRSLPVKDKKSTSTVSKPTGLVPASQIQPQESTSTDTSSHSMTLRERASPIKEPKKDISPTTGVQEDVNPSNKAEMSKKTDSRSPKKEFKIPQLPVKYRKEASKPAKRPAESSLSPTPDFICPSKKSKTEDEMDVSLNMSPPAKRPTNLSLSPRPEFVSPSKKDKTPIPSTEDEEMDTSSNKGEGTSDIPSKECTDIVVSHVKIAASTQTLPIQDDVIEIDMASGVEEKAGPSYRLTSDEMENLIDDPLQAKSIIKAVEERIKASTSPKVHESVIEIDMVSGVEEKPVPSYRLTSDEMENLIDDPLQAKSIKKAVEERLKATTSPKETKGDFSPSEKKGPNGSPRKVRKIGSPGKDVKTASQPDPEEASPSILVHPNVMAYLKLKFKSILSNRNNYMQQIYNYFLTFYSDVNFLFYYSTCIFLMARDIPVEGEVYFTRDVRNLKGKLMRNARELRSHLHPSIEVAKVDIPFWTRSLNEIHKLNAQNEHLLSAGSGTQTTVEVLREYESNLRVIWNRMDQRVLAADGMRLTILEISADFKKLTKDFARYLLMIELMKPNSLASSEGKRQLKVSWR